MLKTKLWPAFTSTFSWKWPLECESTQPVWTQPQSPVWWFGLQVSLGVPLRLVRCTYITWRAPTGSLCTPVENRAWTFLVYEFTERSTTLVFPAGHLHGLCRFGVFSPTDDLYPPVRAVGTKPLSGVLSHKAFESEFACVEVDWEPMSNIFVL